MVSAREVLPKVQGQWWRDRSSRLSRKKVGGKKKKGPITIFDQWSNRWSTALARIMHSNQMLSTSEESSKPTSLVVKHDRVLINNEDSLKSWIASRRRHKRKTWGSKMIRVLRESPLDLLKILRANLQGPGQFLPAVVVEDCLDHLAWLYLDADTCTSSAQFDLIYSIVRDYLEAHGHIVESFSLSQRTIRLLSRHCDGDQLTLFVEKLDQHIHTNTKLHIMPKLVEYGKVGLALSMLKHMPAPDLLLDKVQMFCAILLRAKLEVQNLYRLRSNVLAFMLEAGVRPNRFLANIIILNAAEAGDLSTAWRSHAIAKENGLVPDAGTYTALLKAAFHGSSSLTVVRLVHKDAKLDGWLFKSSQLKFELLYAFYICNNGKYHDKPYSNLLPYYRQLFDVKPLQELGIFPSTEGCIEELGQSPEPTVQALGLIILAWLTENHGSGQVLAVYERYRHYTQHNHSLIAQLAQTDYTANAFIIAFSQSPRTVHLCTQVVQDMLKAQVVRIDTLQSFPSTSDVGHSNKNGIDNVVEDSSCEQRSNTDLDNYEIRRIAPPSVQTWSILSYAFIKNGQSNAAEKVLALMEARGQKPNTVTWNSLLSGYARMQDFPGIVSTVTRMKEACVEDDEWTAKALARVVDRDSLLRNFEESTQEDIDDWNGN
ncbi:hypothetical protein MMC32_002131 [Xylographa parallela]|nr:hypothetical protein [Xylographa parallela]